MGHMGNHWLDIAEKQEAQNLFGGYNSLAEMLVSVQPLHKTFMSECFMLRYQMEILYMFGKVEKLSLVQDLPQGALPKYLDFKYSDSKDEVANEASNPLG